MKLSSSALLVLAFLTKSLFADILNVTLLKKNVINSSSSFQVSYTGSVVSSTYNVTVGARLTPTATGFSGGYSFGLDCSIPCFVDVFRKNESSPLYTARINNRTLAGQYHAEVIDVGTTVVLRLYIDGNLVLEYVDNSPGDLLGKKGDVAVGIGSRDSQIGYSVNGGFSEEVKPFLRAYNPRADYHFFTANEGEYANAVNNGYRGEGLGFPILTTQITGSRPLYRLYNPQNGRHYYTMDVGERDGLVTKGWRYELVAGYLMPLGSGQGVEIYRLYNVNSGAHLYLTNASEKNSILGRFPGVWVQHSSLGKTP